ncbi:MAG TPA: hypothetical protein VL989_01785 [Candidatus Sulfotelmatobacter sp.]|nr:hypothetical protein [Candidatus Sulfotelmatobacter sp.]
MNCPNCHQPIDHGAFFCGNCGYNLSTGNAVLENQAPPQANFQRQTDLGRSHKDSGAAVASFTFGVIGLVVWLVPIAGLIIGVIALVFGIIGKSSRKKVLAFGGMSLAIIAIALSVVSWVITANNIYKNKSVSPLTYSYLDSAQTVSTACYTTKIPGGLKVTRTTGSCTFLAVNQATNELYGVKVIESPSLTDSEFDGAAQMDAKNASNSTAGSSIAKEGVSTFVGSPSYSVTFSGPNSIHSDATYVYRDTAQGNVLFVYHTTQGNGNFDLSYLEDNWQWN